MLTAGRISNLMKRNAWGKTVTYRRLTGQSFDTETGVNTPVYSDISVRAAVRDYAPQAAGSAIQLGDRKVTIAGADLDFSPAKDDRVLIDGVTYAVINPDARNLGESAGLHVLTVRGV